MALATVFFFLAGEVQGAATNTYRRLTWEPQGRLEGLYLRLYGYVRMNLSHNWKSTDGTPSDSSYSFRASRIGTDLKLPQIGAWSISGKVEYDFLHGTDAHPRERMRHLYLKVAHTNGWSLLAGQSYDAWYIQDPDMVAYLYACNRRPQLRLTRDWELDDGTLLSGRLALVQNKGDRLDKSHARANHHKAGHLLPQCSLTAERVILTRRKSRLSLGGAFGEERNEFAARPEMNGDRETWMVISQACIPLWERFTLSCEGFSGKNMDTYFLGGLCRGINQRSGAAIRGHGGWVQGTVHCTPMLRCNYGYAALALPEGEMEAGQRSYYGCHYLNTNYLILPRLRVRAEVNFFNKEVVAARTDDHFRFIVSTYLYF